MEAKKEYYVTAYHICSGRDCLVNSEGNCANWGDGGTIFETVSQAEDAIAKFMDGADDQWSIAIMELRPETEGDRCVKAMVMDGRDAKNVQD